MKETKTEKRERILNRLLDLSKLNRKIGDHEGSHIEADDLLLELINDEEIKDAYEKILKWYA